MQTVVLGKLDCLSPTFTSDNECLVPVFVSLVCRNKGLWSSAHAVSTPVFFRWWARNASWGATAILCAWRLSGHHSVTVQSLKNAENANFQNWHGWKKCRHEWQRDKKAEKKHCSAEANRSCLARDLGILCFPTTDLSLQLKSFFFPGAQFFTLPAASPTNTKSFAGSTAMPPLPRRRSHSNAPVSGFLYLSYPVLAITCANVKVSLLQRQHCD